MSSTFLIFKKELDRFLSNKISAALSIVLPGVLIFTLWTVMGDISSADNNEEIFKVGAINLSEIMEESVDKEQIVFMNIKSLPEASVIYNEIKDGNYEALVVFPDSFDTRLLSSESVQAMIPQQIEIYYNSGISSSLKAYQAISASFDAFESSIVNLFDINAGNMEYDLATKQDKAGFFTVAIIPFMLLTLIFSCSMSVAAESIAGEKERATLATLLATPIKRRTIVRGKLLACSLIGLAIATSSAIGIFTSLPSVMQEDLDLSVYGLIEYGLTALVVMSLTVFIVIIILAVSTFARTTKEAQTLLMPVMILVMGVGLLGMTGSEPQSNIAYYFIPLYNGVEAMIGILSFDVNIINLIACIASNLFYAGVGVLILERMFENEKLMFSR